MKRSLQVSIAALVVMFGSLLASLLPQAAIAGGRAALILGLFFITVPICLLLVSRADYYAACSESERLALATPRQPSL